MLWYNFAATCAAFNSKRGRVTEFNGAIRDFEHINRIVLRPL